MHFNEILRFEIASLRRNDSIWNRFCVSHEVIEYSIFQKYPNTRKINTVTSKILDFGFLGKFVNIQSFGEHPKCVSLFFV